MRRPLVAFAISLIVLGAIHLLMTVAVGGNGQNSLTAGIGSPTLDGIADPGEWTSDSITTTRGVTLRAMMDDENFYILASWPDETMSVTKDQWTWDGQQWNAANDEDRIAFIWEITDPLGNPLNGQAGPSCQTMCHPGEGMATTNGRVDVWHGKASRFLPVGYTDDKYWDTDAPDGRHSDSGSGSGSRNRNQEQTGPEFRAASSPSANVSFLAADEDALASYAAFGSQLGTAELMVPITEGDQFQVGDTIPGSILETPSGNRASVMSVGRWMDGIWTVEFARRLSGEVDGEGMPEDFMAVPGGSVRFTTEIFDNLSDHEAHSFSAAGSSAQADFTVFTLNFPLQTTLYFAQTGNGGGFTAEHVFTNPLSDRAVTATMELFDDNGAPLPIDLAAVGNDRFLLSRAYAPTGMQASVDFLVAPLGSVTIATSGIGDVVDGAAEVSANNTLGGVIRFRIPGVGVAGVGESTSLRGFIVPVRRIRGGINTGLALHHTRSDQAALQQGVTLRLSLRDEQGGEVADRTLEDFPVRGHLAEFVDQLFPGYFAQGGETDMFSGTLVVEVDGGEVAATALELGPNPGEFTTLPVTPIQ